jgi:hypothetical protein
MRDTSTAVSAGRRPDRAHLTQLELADRWRLSGRTLEKWRQAGRGPRYLRVGGRVLYPLEEVARFEAEHLRGGR